MSEAQRLAEWKAQMAAELHSSDDDDDDGGGGGDGADFDSEAAAMIRARYGLQQRTAAPGPQSAATAATAATAAAGSAVSAAASDTDARTDADGRFAGDFDWSGFSQVQELTEKNAQLLVVLDAKDKEIGRLEELVVAMEPVPGLDVESLMAAQKDGVPLDADPRDVKIMKLSKRNRNLNLALQRERNRVSKLKQDVGKLKEVADTKVYPKRLHASSAAPDADAGDEAAAAASAAASAEAQVKALTARLDAQRLKFERAQAELKATQRALAAEVGPDVPLSKVVEDATRGTSGASSPGKSGTAGGWRGRAQKIIMLKTKLKDARTEIAALRDHVGDDCVGDGATSVFTRRTAATAATTTTKRFDVDDAARADLQEMGKERARAAEGLAAELESTTHQLAQVTSQLGAAKARNTTLSSKHNKMKGALKSMLDKASNDDKLVDALRTEVTKLQAKERAARSEVETLTRRLKDAMGFFDSNATTTGPGPVPPHLPRPPVAATSGSGPGSGSAASGAAGRRASPRPSSAEARASARAMVELEEAKAHGRVLHSENQQLRHTLEGLRARLKDVEMQQEEYITRVSELEIEATERSAGRSKARRPTKPRPTSGSAAAAAAAAAATVNSSGGAVEAQLRKTVATLQAEREALRKTFRDAVASRDAEIASLRRLLEDVKSGGR